MVLGALLLGVVAAVAFVIVELRVRAPIVPLDIFKSRQFSATNGVTLLIYGMLGGMFFLLPIELQQVSHYSPTAAGASLLPITFMLFALSSRSGGLSARIGPRLQMSVGPIVVAAGLALFARINAGGNYLLEVLPAVLVFGFGLAITVAPLTATAMSSAPAERSGLASAVNNTVARTGSLLAVALLPAVAGITGDSYLHPPVFETGFQHAALIASVICAAGGLLAAATIRNPRRPPAPQARPPPSITAPPTRHPCAPTLEASLGALTPLTRYRDYGSSTRSQRRRQPLLIALRRPAADIAKEPVDLRARERPDDRRRFIDIHVLTERAVRREPLGERPKLAEPVLLHARTQIRDIRVDHRGTLHHVVDRTDAFDTRHDVGGKAGEHLAPVRHRAQGAWTLARENVRSLGAAGDPKVDERGEHAFLRAKDGVNGVDGDAGTRRDGVDGGRHVSARCEQISRGFEYPQPRLRCLLGAHPRPVGTAALDRCHRFILALVYSS